MLRRDVSIVVLSHSGSKVRQLTASSTLMKAFGGVALAFLVGLVIDYCVLKFHAFTGKNKETIILSQQDTIVSQRRQIQGFTEEIKDLKDRLVGLNDLERKIRIIANIEKTDRQDGLFGVGGSIPEDLDAQIPLTQAHNSLIREMHEQVEQLKVASLTQHQGFESLIRELEEKQNLLASTPAIHPTRGWITSRFGYRISPFTGKRELHKGLDIAGPMGTPIIATANGVVSEVGLKGLLGMIVTVDHGHGLATRYAHLEKATVKNGQRVKRGDIIAAMGNTGRSTGPHLHYEVLMGGIPVNPEKYILD